MKKIVIVGATSAIATACAQLWAQRGDQLLLVGRNELKLKTIVDDLTVRGAVATALALDATDPETPERLLAAAQQQFGQIDILFIAHGTLPNQQACRASIALTMQELETNALSVIRLLTPFANHFERQQRGTLAVITSVAGDRGRQSNYVYGSAKALVTTFLSGLRQRLSASGVSVITIKPGFVDTPMTAEFNKGPLWATPEQVARVIVAKCEGTGGEFYVPWFWWGIMAIIKSIPDRIFRRLSL
ncbi:SDR family oxidoreductase [Ectothiorhodospiraceae bacterium BW-2]|nr:SDR family oxidoreductase [Ectothiorhodospiraceae bacterium BW-2]